jgi:hypothetical protein
MVSVGRRSRLEENPNHFGLILLGLVALLPVMLVLALFLTYPVAGFIILLVLLIGLYGYAVSRSPN